MMRSTWECGGLSCKLLNVDSESPSTAVAAANGSVDDPPIHPNRTGRVEKAVAPPRAGTATAVRCDGSVTSQPAASPCLRVTHHKRQLVVTGTWHCSGSGGVLFNCEPPPSWTFFFSRSRQGSRYFVLKFAPGARARTAEQALAATSSQGTSG